ncbi:MAG: hypothetical protein ACRCT2_01900 [Plesiomonas shigelloides]
MYYDPYAGASDPAPGTFNFRNLNPRESVSRAAGAARSMVQGAAGKAGEAFAKASPFLTRTGSIIGPLGIAADAGFEGYDRYARGEDAQRVITGATTKAAGGLAGGLAGFKAGAALPLPPQLRAVAGVVGGVAGAVGVGNLASWATDRVTDAVRGNDGKGADGIRRDGEAAAMAASERGNFAEAQRIMGETNRSLAKVTAGQTPGGQNLYDMKGRYGIPDEMMPDFKNQLAQQSIGNAMEDMEIQRLYDPMNPKNPDGRYNDMARNAQWKTNLMTNRSAEDAGNRMSLIQKRAEEWRNSRQMQLETMNALSRSLGSSGNVAAQMAAGVRF